ncbi:MAG TPA: hypothetical protein VL346_02915, partial [Acidobacteriaceae bacterium]|nr:hypothetical protein [Acidobacteriaceae bacterium]
MSSEQAGKAQQFAEKTVVGRNCTRSILQAAARSAAVLALAAFCGLPLLEGQSTAAVHPAPVHKPVRHKRKAAKPAPEPAPAPVAVQAPPKPDWPANDPSQPGHVKWDGSRLTITATNASLSQVLHEVSSATGLKVEGLDSSRDQRLFGNFGPAPARDVLNEILEGSGYNVILLGDRGAGNPRELLLATQRPGVRNAGNHPVNNFNQPQDEEPAEEPQPEPEPERPQQGPPPPGARPAQQLLQDLRNQQQQQQQPGAIPEQNP